MGGEGQRDKEDEMSIFDYVQSQEIAVGGYSFYAILMAAMRQADSINTEIFQEKWPEVWEELRQRYNAPGGFLSGEE